MDLFGVKFRGHGDQRRLLCDYGFCGFPGRRDFPLIGTADSAFRTVAQQVVSQRWTYSGTSYLHLAVHK
jgi:NADH-quinone oxidoreductase subunit C